MLRFFLDNIEVITPPKKADQLTERLFYDEKLFIELLEIGGSIIFMANEYDYILSKWQTGNCTLINIEIQKPDINLNWQTITKGFIFVSDVKFNDNAREVECQIVDNSFISKINNNISIQMDMNVPLSKNGINISSYYSIFGNADIFTNSPGGTYNSRWIITIYNAFAALIAFMTDGDVEFDSNFFNNPTTEYTEGNQYALLSGKAMTGPGYDILPTISFKELFTDLQRCYNLRIGIEKASNGKPLIRIEPKSYFRSNNEINCNNIKNVTFERKQNSFYTKLLIGSKYSTETNDFYIFNYLWNTWHSETYLLEGQCNDESVSLDLRFETLIADTVSIKAIANGTVVKDDGIIYVAIAFINGGVNEYWNPFVLYVVGINYNNKSTTNGRIIDRYSDEIFTSIAQYDYFVNDMKSTLTAPQTITGFTNIIFDNDSTGGNFDNGNTYNNTTGIYTCLITGTYRQRFKLTILSTGGSSTFDFGLSFGFAGSGQTIYWYYPGITIATPFTLNAGESASYQLEFEAELLEGTDLPSNLFPATIGVQVNKTAGLGTLTAQSGTFEVFTPASGVFRNFNTNDAYSKTIIANGSIDSQTWENLKTNRNYKINVQGSINKHSGYNMEIIRGIESGSASIQLLGKPI